MNGTTTAFYTTTPQEGVTYSRNNTDWDMIYTGAWVANDNHNCDCQSKLSDIINTHKAKLAEADGVSKIIETEIVKELENIKKELEKNART